MADYFDPRHSSHERHHSQSFHGDPTDENAIRRTATRGSHHSHASAVSESTRSWVYSNQINPPPPPPVSASAAGLTPFHGPRPLPDPQQHHPARRPVHYADTVEDDEQDEYMTIDPRAAGVQRFGYQSDGLGPGRIVVAGPSTLPPSTPGGGLELPARGNRSFVGGFFHGLKKLPNILKVGGSGEKRRLVRRGTFGTEATATTATGLTTGNTLPRYLSNPSIGPSNPQFAHRLSMAVANGSLPPDATPASFQLRPNLAGPQFPAVTVTPPSDGIADEEHAEFYDEPTTDHPQYAESSEHHPNVNERTTVMVYNSDSQTPTITQIPPSQPVQSTSGPRVSYQAELPTRANAQAQTEPFPLRMPTPAIAQPSPRRRPTPHPSPVAQLPKDIVSPTSTSRHTVTTATSYYDPSFSSDLGPIEKFFTGLYHLPWIGHERITVDYRPGETNRAKGKIRSLKKPMASWYHSVMSRARRSSRDLDLLSSENGTGTMSPTSVGNTLSPLGSPISRRSERSSEHRHHRHHHHHSSSKPKRPRARRRIVASASTGPETHVPQRGASPIIPTVYPYTVPPYPPYSYPYIPYPTMPMPQTSPRGPRPRSHRRGPKYPHGYTPYQPMAMPPPPPPPMPPPGQPVYFITPSPPQSQTGGDAGQATTATQVQAQGPVQFSPVLMHFVPGAYNHDPANTMISPPISPHRATAARSS